MSLGDLGGFGTVVAELLALAVQSAAISAGE